MISISGYSRYMTCPYSFYLHYTERLRPSVTSSALVFGAAIDAALNTLLEGKGKALEEFNKEFKDTDKNLKIMWDKADYDPMLLNEGEKDALLKDCKRLGYPGSDVDKLMEDLFKLQGRNAVYFNSMSDPQKACLAVCCSYSLTKKAELIIKQYTADILPKLSNVQRVQEEIFVGDTVRGFLDFIADYDGQTILFDNKTSKRAYTKHNIVSSIQLPLYAKATGIYEVGYIVVNKEIKHYKRRESKVDIQLMTFAVNPDFADEVAETVKDVQKLTEKNVYPKNLNACAKIYGRPCDYIKYCRKGDETGLERKK